jgi:hypothetical protein
MEVWKAFHSSDGGNGSRNRIGKLIFDSQVAAGACPSQSATAGRVKVPLRGVETMVRHAAEVWNACPALRLSATRHQAERAATKFACECPL